MAVLVLAVAGGGAFAVLRDDGPAPPRHAVVSTVVNNPRVNVYYGRSCAGTRGPWFLNVVQGGGNEIAHVAFYLRWSFPAGATSAAPTGRVTVAGGPQPAPTFTLDRGALALSGARPDGTPVTGAGRLEVRLTGTDDAPTLTITESGLDEQVQALGLLSPFRKDGQPVTVPVKRQAKVNGC